MQANTHDLALSLEHEIHALSTGRSELWDWNGRDLVGPDTKIVLANGLHFKAKWARRFDPSDTVPHDFFRRDGRPVRVPFLSDAGMQCAESFDDPCLGFKVIQCFYKMVGREGRLDPGAPCFCILIFLPHGRDGLADLLRPAVTQPDFVMRCAPRREQVVCPCMIPKFKFSSGLDVVSALCQLGLTAPFDEGVADLSGMVSNMPPEGLYVSAVRQTCAVEVDEDGTEAAAATYSASSPTYSPPENPPPPPMSFVADHPFMFAIVEYEKAEVLFLGHVMDPSQEN
ncbi:putative non-inhibitory serpin-10 [Setaria italica]|uniref:putative non-inhibitory serpin-10 n=1 Tax=Setaria italica TaxID=4555 RepID=UPI000BE5C765|nr:putative non-inhibitory serpin-10 [Setaria italica]